MMLGVGEGVRVHGVDDVLSRWPWLEGRQVDRWRAREEGEAPRPV